MTIVFAQCCQISVKVVEKAGIFCYKRRWKYLFCFVSGGFLIFFFFTKGSILGERSKTLVVMKSVWRVNLTKHFSFTIDDKRRPRITDVVFFSGWPNTGVQLRKGATRRQVSDFSTGYLSSMVCYLEK